MGNSKFMETKECVKKEIIRRGDIVVLKKIFQNKYKKLYVETTDVSQPAKVKYVSEGRNRIFLDGWDDVHKIKSKGVPMTSFIKYNSRKAKIEGLYKIEPKITKTISQVQEIEELQVVMICLVFGTYQIRKFDRDIFEDIDLNKGTFITITTTIIPGRQTFDFCLSTDEEIEEWNKSTVDYEKNN